MRKKTFRYNAHSCQYERVSITFNDAILYLSGLMVTSAAMLVAIFFVHDKIVDTKREVALRKENKALIVHHASLSAQLDQLQPALVSLKQKDVLLHQQFFGVPAPFKLERKANAIKDNILLADADNFRKEVTALATSTSAINTRSARNNYYFSGEPVLALRDRSLVNAMPTLPPIPEWKSEWLVSGYGMRINPYHKGLYMHPGVDIALPKGTQVVAAASGVVQQVKQSDLQAGYGNYIEIDHGHGVITRYAHLEEINVKFGTKVQKGDVIGTIGSSGGSVAPHLHYEVIRDGINVDPVSYIIEGVTASEHFLMKSASHQQNQSLD